jgi:hypothetical protein
MSTGKQLLIRTVGFFEMSGATCQSTRRNNAEMLNLNPNNITKFSSNGASTRSRLTLLGKQSLFIA